MRKDLGTDKYVTEMELDQQPFAQKLRVFLLRPFQLLFLEPIVMFLSLYACVIYGLLYMFFVSGTVEMLPSMQETNADRSIYSPDRLHGG